jgi:hypothetical protein
LFIIGIILLIISILSMGDSNSVEKTTLVMNSNGFGLLFLIVGFALILIVQVETMK